LSGQIAVQEALELENAIFIDVRSPGEYRRGSIPGAVNIPLFDDQEREIIGILYKKDIEQARAKGLSLAAPKLPAIIEKIITISRGKTPIIYCWRGGMRSQSIHNVLDVLGIFAYRLEGGYKSFRRYVVDKLSSYRLNKPLFVLNGLTGTGKTEVLSLLEEMGCPCIDLEALACHRGSLFGHLGFTETRSQKDFDALLLNRLQALEDAEYLIIEGEGKRIGPVYQPDFLYRAIQEGGHILLTAPLESRVDRLLREYTPSSEPERQKVKEALLSLKKYLGRENIEQMLALLEEKKYRELVSRLCRQYYDRLYDDSKPGKTDFILIVDSSDIVKAALKIKEFILGAIKNTLIEKGV